MGRHLVRSIGAAGVAVAISFALLALVLPEGGGVGTYASASTAVTLAAAAAGLSAGLLAMGISGAVVAYAHLPPLGSIRVDHPEEIFGLAIFLFNGLVVAVVVSRVRQRRAASAVVGSPSPIIRPWASAASERQASLVEPLTEREVEVLSLLAAGCSNEDIAGSLFVSINTVKTHLKNIYGKLSVTSRTQATARALKLGIIAAPYEAARDERDDERDAA